MFSSLWFLWFFVGVVGSLLSIYVFRTDGRTNRFGELYLAVIGPLFGPIVLVLLFTSLNKNKI
jgi:uncharacterized membrane protein YeaQ/YmgE (transglycosylase-associated protein family)